MLMIIPAGAGQSQGLFVIRGCLRILAPSPREVAARVEGSDEKEVVPLPPCTGDGVRHQGFCLLHGTLRDSEHCCPDQHPRAGEGAGILMVLLECQCLGEPPTPFVDRTARQPEAPERADETPHSQAILPIPGPAQRRTHVVPFALQPR